MSDDLIKRSDAIEVAYQLRRKPNDEEWDWWLRSFNAIPSADRPQGKWIKNYYGTVICSECKCPRRDNRVGHIKYCNACGARMKGADDE